MDDLSDAQVLLLAAQLTATPNLSKFQVLAAKRQDVLTPSLVYRMLLTYLPLDEDVELDQELTILLRYLEDGFSNFSHLDISLDQDEADTSALSDAERSLSSLRLEKVPNYVQGEEQDPLSDFIIAWAHKVESFRGISQTVLSLVDEFGAKQRILYHWANTYLRPLIHLQSTYYVEDTASISLQELESMRGKPGVDVLMSFAVKSGIPSNIGRDLQDVVTPWVRGSRASKRRKTDHQSTKERTERTTSWGDVNEWLFSAAHKDFKVAADAVQQWNGPSILSSPDPDLKEDQIDSEVTVAYIQTVLAILYVSDHHDNEARVRTKELLLQRAANLAQLMPPDFETALPDIPPPTSLQNAAKTDILTNALLFSQNQLTRPSTEVIDLLHGVLSTQAVLNKFKIESTTKSICTTSLFDSEEKQKQHLRAILNQIPRLTRSNLDWSEVRVQLHWLRSWSIEATSKQDGQSIAYFGRIAVEYLDVQILDAMLMASDFRSVKDIYLSSSQSVLSKDQVSESVFSAILNAYDNASNGNRSRGGVRRASDMLQEFRSSFDDTTRFEQLEHLLKATHSMSFYQLILQHGVPFQPVSIRVSNDPISLLEKILDQNSNAYAKLDDLLGIARNLVLADLHTPSYSDFAPGETVPLERRLFDAEHRVTYAAIIAALSEHDFDTAYSLITTRLTASQDTNDSPFADDTSWRAAYAAGQSRPSVSPSDIHKQISSLQKRMDLLSTALTLAPTPDPLPDILATWRRCEEELESLKSQALEEERALDSQVGDTLPGAFGPSDRDLDVTETKRLLENRRAYNSTGPSYEEEAPIGLFDVARGAANALRKNAFPLRGAPFGQRASSINVYDSTVERESMEGSGTLRSSGEISRPGSSDGHRVRKRDMLSNAVTGGFVSGMSWVLGAQSMEKQEHGPGQ